MRIIITMNRLLDVREYMEELYDKYNSIVARYKRLQNAMVLVNGDTIKGYSAASRKDGLSADVAIGVDAEYITCRSKIKEPVWTVEKLHKYLEGIKNTMGNQ